MNWYDLPESKRSPEQKVQAQRAYCKFLNDNREVIRDMQRRVRQTRLDMESSRHLTASEWALGQLSLEYFMVDTLYLCGVTDSDQIDVLRFMGELARNYKPPREVSDIPEGYDE